jgi:ferric-dicitrate binding protein FerR (iron transport regulator)
MDYSKYQVEDFILDDSFCQWVKEENNEAIAFWDNWLIQNPSKSEEVEKAKEIVLQLSLSERGLKPETIATEWSLLINNPRLDITTSRSRPYYANAWKVAASIAILITVSIVFYLFNSNRRIAVSTIYGERKEVVLPDQSLVTLNSNSTLTYSSDWSDDEDRIVKLEGEAFFSVTHKKNNQKFIVKTGGLDVRVLGTEFNVNTRRGSIKVVLSSGKVQLSDQKKRELIMQPGEKVVYTIQKQDYKKEKVQAGLYSSWKKNVLQFDNTPIREIATLIEDNYGKEVIINDTSIANRNFTGTYPADDIDILIKALSGVYQIKIKENGNTLILEN